MVDFSATDPNHLCFSALVDAVVRRSGRAEKFIDIVQSLRSTIQECQAFGVTDNDLVELEIGVNTDPFVWAVPSGLRFLLTAQNKTFGEYYDFKRPGRQLKNAEYFYYRTGSNFVFSDSGGLGATIAVAYYKWSHNLGYFARLNADTTILPGGPYSVRQAYFDVPSEQWMYLNNEGTAYVTTLNDEVEELARQEAAANWIILKWPNLLIEGTLAKIHSMVGEPQRSRSSFAIYKQLQDLFLKEEGVTSIGA